MERSIRARGAIIAAALVLAACATSSRGVTTTSEGTTTTSSTVTKQTPGPQQVSIQVTNDHTPPEQITLFVRGAGGSQQLLGNVNPGQTATFTYTPTVASGRYVLVGQTASGSAFVSDPFTIDTSVSGLSWATQGSRIVPFTP